MIPHSCYDTLAQISVALIYKSPLTIASRQYFFCGHTLYDLSPIGPGRRAIYGLAEYTLYAKNDFKPFSPCNSFTECYFGWLDSFLSFRCGRNWRNSWLSGIQTTFRQLQDKGDRETRVDIVGAQRLKGGYGKSAGCCEYFQLYRRKL